MRYDSAINAENLEIKELLRQELPRRDRALEMIETYDERLISDALAYLSGSKMRSAERTMEMFIQTPTLHWRAEGQMRVLVELFEDLSTHVDEARLGLINERLEQLATLKLVTQHQRASAR